MVGFICCVIVLASVGAVKGLQGTPSMDDAGIPEELLDYFSHKLLPHDSHEAFLLESSRAVAPDADVGKDMVTIATERGYGIDTHFVTTKDGYILTMFNIARPRFSDPLATPRNTYPVILQHGLLDSSYTWVANYEKQSLGYLLADAGFDVWFGNNRGNRYGRNHTTLNPDGDEAFWSFTYDEMALYDVPAMIDYVTEFTSSKSTSWVGHSEGTIQMFAAGTITEQFDHVKSALSKLDLFVALAPVAYVKNLESKDLQFLARTNILDRMYKRGIYEFLAYGPLSEVAPRICQRTPEFCHVFLRTICGPTKNLNDSRIQVYVSETPAGTSTMNMYHWMQGVLENKFQRYDWGSDDENLLKYGQSTPPEYALEQFFPKVALFIGSNDYLADPTDVQQLIDRLPVDKVVFKDVQEDYAHLDFTWGKNANERIYNQIIKLLSSYSSH